MLRFPVCPGISLRRSTWDTTQVEIGQSIHIGDLKFEHLEFLAPADQILMAIERPRREVEEETEESTVAEEEE